MEENNNKQGTWIIVASILAVGMIVTALVGVYGLSRIKQARHVLDVVGSARKQIRSDLAVWTGTFSASAATREEAYNAMTRSAEKVRTYMAAKGVAKNEMVLSAITVGVTYRRDKHGNQLSEVESYQLSQTIEVTSSDVDRVADLSRKATELINDGVGFQSNAPRYFYTKIADLKIEVLAMAARDARQRAEKLADNTGAHAGSLASAEQGVFQITAVNSTEVSDSGIYDTHTIDKEITAVVICKFDIDR